MEPELLFVVWKNQNFCLLKEYVDQNMLIKSRKREIGKRENDIQNS